MSKVIWINPVVKGSCTPDGGCKSICCKFRVYTDAKNYTLEWCQYYNQDPAVINKCMNYENRWDGCRNYPDTRVLIEHGTYPNCGYYLEEA